MSSQRVALVTGASGGIGRAIAVRLAKSGDYIIVHYNGNKEAAEQTLALVKEAGSDGMIVQANLANLEELNAMFTAIDEKFDQLDVLINNAGIGVQIPIDDVDEASYDRVFSVNTKSYFFAIQQAAKRMKNGGHIVNVASAIVNAKRPNVALYAASRNAVISFNNIAAIELGPKGIYVNAVSPGPVSPGLADQLPPPMLEKAKAMSPFNRIGHADEVAELAAWLASPANTWISGQNVIANGASMA